jgi:hypothetical protein
MSSAAGELLDVLDDILPLNANWSIYDDRYDTYKSVYRQQKAAENSLFYLEIDDSNAGYALVRLNETWDPVNHLGSGKITGQAVWWKGSTYGISLRDLSVLFAPLNSRVAGYAGQPQRFDVSYNTPVLGGGSSTTVISAEGLGHGSAATTGFLQCMKDPSGNMVNLNVNGRLASDQMFIRSVGTGCFIYPRYLVLAASPYSALGLFDGVVPHFNNLDLEDGDTVIIGGVEWEVLHWTSSYPGTILIERA